MSENCANCGNMEKSSGFCKGCIKYTKWGPEKKHDNETVLSKLLKGKKS